MKISTRGNCVLISIPKGEIEQLGVEQDGFLVEGLNMDGIVFGRKLLVSICSDKKRYPVDPATDIEETSSSDWSGVNEDE